MTSSSGSGGAFHRLLVVVLADGAADDYPVL
jgi:hypothetical protein